MDIKETIKRIIKEELEHFAESVKLGGKDGYAVSIYNKHDLSKPVKKTEVHAHSKKEAAAIIRKQYPKDKYVLDIFGKFEDIDL